ncbi:MAG: enoyl-CoA hydratase-related protein [Acidimicrobiales bacterium]
MSEPTTSVVAGGVATITLDAPERRNAFGQPLLRSLLAALDAAEADDDVRVIVLTNTGTTFSAGADLKEDRSTIGPDDPTFFDVVARIDHCPKPVVGRIAGHAAGGGAAVVVACDLAVLVDTARLGITEVRLGLPPVPVAAILAHRLTPRALSEAFLAAEMMSAQRAVELGMANMAVPGDELDAAVERYVDALLRGGPSTLAVTKRALAAMVGRTAEENAEVARTHGGDGFASGEAREGVAAFVEKRPASWIPEGR